MVAAEKTSLFSQLCLKKAEDRAAQLIPSWIKPFLRWTTMIVLGRMVIWRITNQRWKLLECYLPPLSITLYPITRRPPHKNCPVNPPAASV